MKYLQFLKQFKSQVDILPYDRKVSLAISVCKKLVLDYQDFFEVSKWGNPNVLLNAINLIQTSSKESLNLSEVKDMLEKVNLVTPDTEDFENASYALNACTAIYETLEFLIDNDSNHIANIGTYLTDTIDFKIQENKNLQEDEIAKHL
jgi:uncharacterized protein YjaG (DUF416 family)